MRTKWERANDTHCWDDQQIVCLHLYLSTSMLASITSITSSKLSVKYWFPSSYSTRIIHFVSCPPGEFAQPRSFPPRFRRFRRLVDRCALAVFPFSVSNVSPASFCLLLSPLLASFCSIFILNCSPFWSGPRGHAGPKRWSR